MNYKQIKDELRDFGFDLYEIKEIICEVLDENDDFYFGDYRFIHEDSIYNILVDEMSNDTWLLGCFSADALSEVTGIDKELIDIIQNAAEFERLGNYILNNGFVEQLANAYVEYDGYGHHFAHYDGIEYEIGNYYVFKVN